jgi:hypothetical protein
MRLVYTHSRPTAGSLEACNGESKFEQSASCSLLFFSLCQSLQRLHNNKCCPIFACFSPNDDPCRTSIEMIVSGKESTMVKLRKVPIYSQTRLQQAFLALRHDHRRRRAQHDRFWERTVRNGRRFHYLPKVNCRLQATLTSGSITATASNSDARPPARAGEKSAPAVR